MKIIRKRKSINKRLDNIGREIAKSKKKCKKYRNQRTKLNNKEEIINLNTCRNYKKNNINGK